MTLCNAVSFRVINSDNVKYDIMNMGVVFVSFGSFFVEKRFEN